MKKIGGVTMKKNWGIRILCLLLFLGLSGSVMFSIYKLSSENGYESNARSETVTETIKNEVNTKLNEKGVALVDKVKYYVILYSPYGSDWNANIRKVAHFSIYFALAGMVYISFAILGMKKVMRFILTILICFLFACADEYYQAFTGRTSSFKDVLIDTTGAFSCTMLLTMWSCFVSFIYWLVSNIRKQDDMLEEA